MNESASSVVTDEQSRTVTIRQEEYSLQEGTFRKGYHHVIYAGTVRVKKGFVNPGCDVTVYAARVIVDRGGGKIDVSGVNAAPPSPARQPDATTYRPQTYDGADGANGANGQSGGSGGSITLVAGRLEGGALELLSAGGEGGGAQSGGNGKKGATPPERPVPGVPKPVKVGSEVVQTGQNHYREKAIMGWKDNDEMRRIGYLSSTGADLWVTRRSETGANGGNGGNAGLAGRPGDGGKGGRIVLRTLVKDRAVFAGAAVRGGEPGKKASHGSPGDGAEGGLGAKYLYMANAGGVSIPWSAYDAKKEWNQHWNTENSKTVLVFAVDHFENLKVASEYIQWVGKYKTLKLRAPSGGKGKKGGYGPNAITEAPPVPAAVCGDDGSVAIEQVDTTGAEFRNVAQPYLLMLQRSITTALLQRDVEGAAPLLQWLLVLTAAYRGDPTADATEEAKERHRIHHDAEHALLTLGRDPDAADQAVRCSYRDIERYTGFVEASLGHVARQEKHYRAYVAARDDVPARKRTLDEAIAEAQDHIAHLTGSTLAPGSIRYAAEKETQLKTAISELDVQIMSYSYQLNNMPKALQEEIDAKIREDSKMDAWQMLELIGMAAGVLINFASAGKAVVDMFKKVGDFYKQALEVSSWKDILNEIVWNRQFDEVMSDAKTLMDTDEWKGLSKGSKAFATSVTDYWGKIEAYEALQKSKKVEFQLDRLDVQARILIFDTAKLELKKQRNEFKAYIVRFIDSYDKAREWKHVFSDYFDTCETRFDLLAHLADVQAERREHEYQRSVCTRNLALLRAQRDTLDFDPTGFLAEDTRDTLEANLHLALEQALRRIMDERRALRIWTLTEPVLPRMPKTDLSAESLRSKLHEPLWTSINSALSSGNLPARRDASDAPFVWTRDAYPKQFEEFAKTGRMTLALPMDETSKVFFERIIDAKVYLRGATVAPDSAVYCVLRHPGVSEFMSRDRTIVTCYQEPRSIELSYIETGTGPDYHYAGAIAEPFDTPELARIRYSPYTTWEVQVIRDYRQNARSMTYNRDIRLEDVQQVELRFDLYFNTFHMPKKSVRAAAPPATTPPMLSA